MTECIEDDINFNDVAVTTIVEANDTTAVNISAASNRRLFFYACNCAGRAVWIRLYDASVDNIKQGIFRSHLFH